MARISCGCLARPWSISEPSLLLPSGLSVPLPERAASFTRCPFSEQP